MPNSPSAEKRLRQSFVRRARNRSVKSALRSAMRKIRKEIDDGNVSEAESMMPTIQKQIDQAAAKGVVHRNRAARLKSNLVSAIQTRKAAS